MSIETRFVKSILEDEGKRLMQNQAAALGRKLTMRTGRLFNTRKMSVTGGSEMDGQLSFDHTVYQRFLDMKTLRYGSHEVKRNRRIHNRFVFGHYTSIASRLMYDLTDEVVAEFKEELKSK